MGLTVGALSFSTVTFQEVLKRKKKKQNMSLMFLKANCAWEGALN